MLMEFIQAKHGDAIFIKWIDSKRDSKILLIDSGVSETFSTQLKKRFDKLQKLDGFLLTHIDDDHIGGFKKYLESNYKENNFICHYFINFPELIEISDSKLEKSYGQASTVLKKLKDRNELSKCHEIYVEKSDQLQELMDNIKITVLSPGKKELNVLKIGWKKYLEDLKKKQTDKMDLKKTKKIEDLSLKSLEELAEENDDKERDITNDSSVVLLLTSESKSILLLGDSNPEVVSNNFKINNYSKNNKITVDFVKLSHHGSKNNLSNELVSLIDCNNFIISTNGGGTECTKHPDRKTIAKIVCSKQRDFSKQIKFYFNYDKNTIIEKRNGKICTIEEENKYNFKCITINEGEYL